MKLGVIVPYRKRPTHLRKFRESISEYLKDYDYDLIVVEQSDDLPFNRGKLLNIGFKTATLAIAWLLNQGEHIIPIPGTRSVNHLNQLAAARDIDLTDEIVSQIERILPIGWAYGDRYSDVQWVGPERYC